MVYKDSVKKKEYQRDYREKNKEQLKEKKKEYREKNKEQRKEQRKEYYENNKEREKEQRKEYREKNKKRDKEKKKEYYEKNKEQVLKQRKEYREKNKEQITEKKKEYRIDINQHVYDSIIIGEINERRKWDLWCNSIKCGATKNKHPYSDDFTNDIMFEMMVQGCFYCGELATTIDRIDSKLGHTIENCVGCCHGCNISKGVTDPSTFIRKAYYRVRGKYYDDDIDIWFVHKNKPTMCDYKRGAKNKGVSFELTKSDFETLVNGDCEYCHRSPTTWFGIDRVVPSEGYVLGNVVSCCWDCNNDKSTDEVYTMISRNERIAVRMIAGELVIKECEKVVLRTGKSV